jgi:hypothetical protein
LRPFFFFYWYQKVLYEKIKQKKIPVVYKTDKIANLHGHEVLRTTVRHYELNPIELIWEQIKGFVAKNNTTFGIYSIFTFFLCLCDNTSTPVVIRVIITKINDNRLYDTSIYTVFFAVFFNCWNYLGSHELFKLYWL